MQGSFAEITALEHQRHLGAWSDGHRNPRCVWTRSAANTIPISTNCNHTESSVGHVRAELAKRVQKVALTPEGKSYIAVGLAAWMVPGARNERDIRFIIRVAA